MSRTPYPRFQQEIGNIIIVWARAEERFRALLAHVAGLDRDAGEIVFANVSAHKQRSMLVALTRLRYSAVVQSDIAHCVALHERHSANRNLFAHGHVGFISLGDAPSIAMRFKPHVGREVVQRGWNVQWTEVEKIAPAIEAFDSFVGYLIGCVGRDLDSDAVYLSPDRPELPVNYSARWFDVETVFAENE